MSSWPFPYPGFHLVFLFVFLIPSPAWSQFEWKRCELDIGIEPAESEVQGTVNYEFNLTETWDSLRLDSRGITIYDVRLDGDEIRYTQDTRYLTVYSKKRRHRRRGDKVLSIEFQSKPRQAFYFLGWNDTISGNEQFWTQGQGKHHSHWFPGFDRSDIKMEFDLIVRTPEPWPLISNGVQTGMKRAAGQYVRSFDMNKPMTTYLVALASGPFEFLEGRSASGVPLRWYYPQGSEDRFEPTYRFSVEIFDWLQDYLKMPYPWEKYDQVPVRDFMYGGMENTGATLFNSSYLVDSLAFEDVNYVSTNAHELAHQWFGNLVTEMGPEDHWLHEGFATFFGSKAEIRFLGESEGYWALYDEAQMLRSMAEEGTLQSLTDPSANTETFYQKGTWALIILEDILGEETLRNLIREFLKMYAFGNARVEDFLSLARRYSPKDLSNFEREWIQSEGFPYEQAEDYLRRRVPEIKRWLEMEEKVASDRNLIGIELERPRISFEYASLLLEQLEKPDTSEFVRKSLESDSRNLRKAAVLSLTQAPPDAEQVLWNMVEDPSYAVRERLLWLLWNQGGEASHRILDTYRNQTGLPNRSLRSLWLMLALATEGFSLEEKEAFYRELKSYSSPMYDFSVREFAFEYLRLIGALDTEVIDHLVNASVHPYWRFRDYARGLLSGILDNPASRMYLKTNMERYTEEEQSYLKSNLN